MTRRLLDAFADSTPPVPPMRARVLAALTEAELRGAGVDRPRPVQRGDRGGAGRGETTVRTHVRHILDKLELRNRVQAVILAYDAGLVEPNLR